MKQSFTKDMLRTGYSVETRNGDHYRVMITDQMRAINKSGWLDLGNLD